VKAETAKSETPQPTAEAPVAPVEATQTKNDAPAKSDAPVKAETAKADARVVDDTPEAQPTQAQAPPPQQPEAPPQPQVIAQAAPAPVQRVAPPSAETEPSNTGDAAPEAPTLDAPDDKRTVKADAEPRSDTPKANAAPSANTKETFAALAALTAQDGGEQAPAQTTPASAIAGTELTPQSSQVTAENVARAAPAAAQVSREIIRRFNGQTTSFELRLDPPELGKVEVRLEVSRDHKVTAVVAAENPAALAELARHARDLQQALQSAGLDLSDKGLSFDLKQQRESRADSEGGSSRSNTGGQEAAPTSTPTPSRPIGLESWRGVRVDLVA
jgi:flagellar hook-length control protein FliK